MKAILLAGVFAFAVTALAQDPGMDAAMQASQAAAQANQMAMDAAMQANQMAMQAAQQANDQAMQAMQAANNNNDDDTVPRYFITAPPRFSVRAGKVAAGTLVKIQSPTHKAKIYYTTNGWSPTIHSRRYTGRVAINRDTVLQAIAVGPNMNPSLIARVQYKVPGSKQEVPAPLNTNGVLLKGTRLELATTATASSKTLDVVDTLPFQLNQDVTAGGKIVLPKGTPVAGIVTEADAAGHLGRPGNLAFEVHSLAANGITVPLQGGESLDAPFHVGRIVGLWMIPVAGTAVDLAMKGDNAVIQPGMTFPAFVAADTPLTAQAAPAGPVPPPAS